MTTVAEQNANSAQKEWTEVITPKKGLFDLRLNEIWRYRDLIVLFVRRDVVAGYKQTVLGPLWYLIQPIMTTIIFSLIFGRIAGISTDGIPPIVFYMLGIVTWSYFSTCLNRTATTFTSNAEIFGKVYFPRLTVPIAAVISSLVFFGFQFGFFMVIWVYYFISKPGLLNPNIVILWAPYILFLMATMGLGLGIIISSATTKYRDFNFLVGFGVQLWMYISPVIYPTSVISTRLSAHPIIALIFKLNPITPLIETLRYGFLGKGQYSLAGLGYSTFFVTVVLLLGIVLFNRVQRSFMDTV